MKKYGICIWRFNPIHIGHERLINKMLDNHGYQKSLLIIWSSNTKNSLRHFFKYTERKKFILDLFPDLKIVGLPDYENDYEWLIALKDIIKISFSNISNVTFYGWSSNDIYYLDNGFDVEIVDRFETGFKKISSTKVRDLLIKNQKLDSFVNQKIIKPIEDLFWKKWKKF